MNTQNKITEFLIRHNYILKVVFVNNIFSSDIFCSTVKCEFNDICWSYQYEIYNKKEDLYKVKFMYQDQYESLILPSFIIRWYIFLDILRFCRDNNLSYYIIKCFDSDGNETGFDSGLHIQLSEESKIKESLIQPHITNGINNKNFSKEKELKDLGLFHYWMILKGLLI